MNADPNTTRSSEAHKFGTWGIGNKPATEDWDEDFDFADLEPVVGKPGTRTVSAADSGVDVFVPEEILEQQSNILANIELLREWATLIEELKEMRDRAVALGINANASDGVFAEVDAMISLADQESEEQSLPPRRSITSTPDFNVDEFEGAAPPRVTQPTDRLTSEESFGTVRNHLLDQNTIGLATKHTSSTITRPRKNSEAVARSVIQALHDRTLPVDDDKADVQDTSQANKKVPFDTTTLKHIVPYVHGLMRQLKQVVWDVENLQPDLQRSPTKSNSVREQPTTPAADSPPCARRTLSALCEENTLSSGSASGSISPPQVVEELTSHSRMMAV